MKGREDTPLPQLWAKEAASTFSVGRGSSEAGLALLSGSQSGTEQAWASGYSLGFGGGSKDPFSVKGAVACKLLS